MAERIQLDTNPVRWDRATWVAGDREGTAIVLFLEFNAGGAILRQIELAGPLAEPTVAASAVEWWEAQGWVQQAATAELLADQEIYGTVADGSVHEWGPDYPGRSVDPAEFERAWADARAHLEQASGSR